jgi:hypothetical protein
VPDSAVDLVDLVDLKMLPAWVNEPAQGERYAQVEGEKDFERRRGPHDRPRRDRKRPRRDGEGIRRGERLLSKTGSDNRRRERPDRKRQGQRPHRGQHRDREGRPKSFQSVPLPPITVRFLPQPPAFEKVVAQIKSGSVAYSLFALARLFLEKPTRHDVRLTASEELPLFQLGEDGALSVNREFLERDAFRSAQPNFYKIEVSETEPIKGNFTNIARCKLSGTVLGPTNHHDYQRRLRNLYEQRFQRRMSFPEYQRQVEIVTNPELVEIWKDDARKVTTFSTLRDETPITFSSATEAERHFRQHYLPGLVRTVAESTISGADSRQLHDRVLYRLIENQWTRESRSPSQMMQELATQFRQSGLHVFRHRRGMLFVSPIYPRPFAHDEATVSPHVRTVLEAVAATPRIGRKELADKLNLGGEEEDRAKLALASVLRWLISAGHAIEFNDGSLDLPRVKAKAKANETGDAAAENAKPGVAATVASTAEPEQQAETPTKDVVAVAATEEQVGSTESRSAEEAEIGGS